MSECRKISIFGQPFNFFNSSYDCQFSDEVVNFCSKLCKDTYNNCSKIVFLGEVGVGKTSIIQRFCRKTFLNDYKPTIGVDFAVEKFEILGIPFSLHIWDTAGQEKFRSLACSYYRAAHAIVVVFDFSRVATLAKCAEWIRAALNEYESRPRPFIFIVGNKTDVVIPHIYEEVEGNAEKLTKHFDGEFWPISSKTGENVDKMFFRVASLVFQSFVFNEMRQDEKRTEISTICLEKKLKRRDHKKKSCKTCA